MVSIYHIVTLAMHYPRERSRSILTYHGPRMRSLVHHVNFSKLQPETTCALCEGDDELVVLIIKIDHFVVYGCCYLEAAKIAAHHQRIRL
jgi:hypothetical protein